MVAPGPPKYLFDTQIISEVERGDITQDQWDAILSYIRSVGEYWISPLTVTELLWGLNNSDQQYFDAHQRRFRILYAKGAKYFFDFPRFHVAKILGVPYRRTATIESDFAPNIEVLLWAQSKADLESGVYMPHMKRAVRLRLDRFHSEIQNLQTRFVSLLSTLKGTAKKTLEIDIWAQRILREYDLTSDARHLTVFAEGLSAAYEHEIWMLDKARNKNYDVTKKTSDLVDGQQLVYLFDPSVIIVSKDSDLCKIIKRSPQRERILGVSLLLERAKSR